MALKLTNIRSYYASFNMYVFAMGLIGVFINLFFFSTGSYLDVLYFQLTTYLCAFAAFAMSGYLMQKHGPKFPYTLGASIFIIMIVTLFAASGFFSNFIIFGFGWGIAIGIFYGGNNPMTYDITKEASRMSFISTNNYIGGVVSFVAPVVAGVLIQFSSFSGVGRYVWDFSITALFLAISIIFILTVKDDDGKVPKYSLKKNIIRGKEGHAGFSAYFALDSIFVRAFTIVLPIYVFQITHSYIITGIFAGYTTLIAVAANFAARRGFRRDGLFVNIAIPGIVVSSFVVLFPSVINPLIAVFIFGGLYNLFSTPLDNAVLVDYMDFQGRNTDIDREMFWVNREFYLMIGRVAVLVPMIFIAYFITNTLDFITIMPFLSMYALVYYKIVRKPGMQRIKSMHPSFLHRM
ncbi:MAG: MFS transporter [Candidatus Marsarchaeota archaeon]|nr:MFS transporter [Candidatus Marsarchaeota archaeon]